MGTRRGRSSYGGRNNRKRAVGKQAAGWVLLALGCFLFGFMVVSRMIPTTAAPDPAGAQSRALPPSRPDGAAIDDSETKRNQLLAMRRQNPPRRDTNLDSPGASKIPSPTIDPALDDTKVQQPESPDTSSKESGDDTPAPADAKPDGTKPDLTTPDPAKTDPTKADPAKTDPAKADALAGRHRRRRRRGTADNTAAEQTPGSPDAPAPATSTTEPATSSQTPPPDTTSTSNTAPPANTTNSNSGTSGTADTPALTHTRYRVQAGIFSTQDAANELAQKLKDKGFAATVQSYDQGGRTLYRVQHAVYKHRSNAEAEQHKLSDAGFDATVKGD
jgi:cell division protein FtsN